MTDSHIVFAHIETTGLNPEYGDKIKEIGAFKLGQKDLQAGRLAAEALHITSKTDGTIDAEDFAEFQRFSNGFDIVCFNAGFHINFFWHTPRGSQIATQSHWICALELARDALPSAPSHKLMDLTSTIRPPTQCHGVLEKTYRTMALYAALNAT